MKKHKNLERLVVIVIMFSIIIFQLISTSYSVNNNEAEIETDNYLYSQIINGNYSSEHLINNNDEYYFKGDIVNNYVIINNEYWRIVSIDKDNNIKIIKDKGINDSNLYSFSNHFNSFDYINSNVYRELNNWYEKFLKGYDEIIKNYDYCIKYINNECINTINSKIGLLNKGEVIKSFSDDNSDYYLMNGEGWWIIGVSNDSVLSSYNAGYVNYIGEVSEGFIDIEKTIRPVIVLNNKVTAIGDGTKDNPYVIE